MDSVTDVQGRQTHPAARHHIHRLCAEKIHNNCWELWPHPPCYPDQAPSDYDLFLLLKAEMRGQHCATMRVSKKPSVVVHGLLKRISTTRGLSDVWNFDKMY